MKANLVKKLVAIGCTVAMAVSAAACGNTVSGDDVSADKNQADYKVAIVKQMDHASLDEIANAIAAQLDAIEAKEGVSIDYEIYSGQGEQTTLMQIGNQVVMEGVDAIIPIATLAAQVMTSCAEDTKTPVVFAAISDPEAAELTGIDYVTGTSDALNTAFIFGYDACRKSKREKRGIIVFLV